MSLRSPTSFPRYDLQEGVGVEDRASGRRRVVQGPLSAGPGWLSLELP